MIDIEVSYECDQCHKTTYGDELFCPDCYEKIKTERDLLKKENERLKRFFTLNHINIPQPLPNPVYLCPALPKLLNLQRAAR